MQIKAESFSKIPPTAVKFLTLIYSSMTKEAIQNLLESLRVEKIDVDNLNPPCEKAKAVLMETNIDFGGIGRST